jgi:acetyltransferase-like isoleucine patch superfamily enzyme
MKKVTIMIPTYNQSHYIEQAINSALEQSYKNLEVIISDDSTDNKTEKIIKEKYLSDSRIKYFHNIPSLGRVGNYHKTLYERATGDYVLNLDGDDWLTYNHYISEAVDILSKNDVVCVFAKIQYYYESNNVLKYNNLINKLLQERMSGKEFFYKYVFYENISFNHLTLIYNRKKAIDIGFYEEDIVFSDAYSFGKLIKNNHLAYIDKFCGVWRNHGNNASLESSTQDTNINFENLLAHVNLIANYYKDVNFKNISFDKWVEKYKVSTLYPHVSSMIKSKKYKELLYFISELKKYDQALVIPIIIFSVKKIIKFIIKSFIRKLKSGFKKLNTLLFNKIKLLRIGLLEENIQLGKNISIGRDVIIKTTDNGNIVIEDNVSIEGNCYIYAQHGEIIISKNSFIGFGSQIVAKKSIKIGKDSLISAYTIIRDANHGIDASSIISSQPHNINAITIEDDVWLGSHSVVTAGTTIGRGVVVGANSVVTKDIERYIIVGGVPAKFIKHRVE